MHGPVYKAARAAASRIHAHFAHHLELGRRSGRTSLASLPARETVEAVIDAAFWASLRREEGHTPRLSLAYVSPDEAAHPLRFDRPLPLEPGALTRVAAAVEREGIHLGVWPHEGTLWVWGTTRTVPALCLVLEVAAPGLLVIKHHRGEEAEKYVNVAVLEGDQIKVVDEHASSLPDCPTLLTSLLGFDAPASWVQGANVVVQLAVSMRAHGRGGLMVVVPADTDGWRDSVVSPVPYAVSPPYRELAELAREHVHPEHRRTWLEALGRAVDGIAGLTAVDGATVLDSRYELLGFGAKITRRRGAPPVEQVTVTEPIEGGVAALVHPEQLGGTRHLAAAQFVQDQRESIALVASQDGRFTVLAFSPREGMVHAHRIETLLR